MTFAEKHLQLRKREGYSQEDLADRLEVSRQAISRWEMGTAVPDSINLLHISKLFGVSTDYLLNNEYESDNDIPKVKESSRILHMNLSLIAIISQAAFLNMAMRPLQSNTDGGISTTELVIKLIPLLASSIWMAHNLRYEKNAVQYRKNTKIELLYCIVQVAIALFGYYSKLYWAGALLLVTVALVYILWINPKFMNRRMTKQKSDVRYGKLR